MTRSRSRKAPRRGHRHGAPQMRLGAWAERELVVDLFAGGGGASEGIARALGRHPDIAKAGNSVAVPCAEAIVRANVRERGAVAA